MLCILMECPAHSLTCIMHTQRPLVASHAVTPTTHTHLQGEVLDEGGWEVYKEDWRYFFDCMLAPVARQVGEPGGAADQRHVLHRH
jgi:hypothetical protein